MNLLITEYNFSANRFVAAVTFKQNFFNRYLKHFLKYFKLARKKKKKNENKPFFLLSGTDGEGNFSNIQR